MGNQLNQLDQLKQIAALAGTLQAQADKRAQEAPSPTGSVVPPTIIVQPTKG